MIDPQLYLAFVAAVIVLMLIPGSNVALIVANSVAYGTRFGLLTVAGTSAAMLLQLGVTALGMTAVLTGMGYWFELVRLLGVGYLLWLGIRQWRAPPVDLTRVAPQPRSARRIFARGLLVSLANPKTLLFYGAFFPQFVTPGAGVAGQVALLAATFVILAVLLDGGWAIAAGRARFLLAARGRLRNRISGGMLIGAGVGLALVRRS